MLQVRLVLDGVPGAVTEDLRYGPLLFSPAGDVAYAARKKGAWILVTETGVGTHSFNALTADAPRFSDRARDMEADHPTVRYVEEMMTRGG